MNYFYLSCFFVVFLQTTIYQCTGEYIVETIDLNAVGMKVALK